MTAKSRDGKPGGIRRGGLQNSSLGRRRGSGGGTEGSGDTFESTGGCGNGTSRSAY